MASAEALLTNIQHFCLHDGPGIRSIVFFKGCPLRCQWCHNPETWDRHPQHAFKPHLCIDCRRCVEACGEGAIAQPGERGATCTSCFQCTEACPSGALTRMGKETSIEAVLETIIPEIPYYRASGGGVTLSGGEPTFAAPHFAIELTRALHARGVQVTLETCGLFDVDPQSTPSQLVSMVDLILFDLKLFDPLEHRKRCGVPNDPIIASLRTLRDRARNGQCPPLWPRLPLVPGITESRDLLTGWSKLLLELELPFVTLIPFHSMGTTKRAWLGIPLGPEISALSEESLETARSLLCSQGVECFEPGEEAWELIGKNQGSSVSV